MTFYAPRNEVVGGYTGFTMSLRLYTNHMSYDNLNCVSENLLKFYLLFTGEERRIPFIFDDFHFCRSRVIIHPLIERGLYCNHLVCPSVCPSVQTFVTDISASIGRNDFIPPLIERGLYCNQLVCSSVCPSIHTFVTDISAATGRNDLYLICGFGMVTCTVSPLSRFTAQLLPVYRVTYNFSCLP
jgi:hypothetical protein